MEDFRRAIEAVYGIESARLIAGLVKVVRDIDLAEDLAQDARARRSPSMTSTSPWAFPALQQSQLSWF